MDMYKNHFLKGKSLWNALFKSSAIPVIIQSEAAECGLACICMVACYHGKRTSLSEIRRTFNVSLKGSKLNSIMDMSDKLGLSPRPIRLEVNELQQLKVPCILHWDMSHFIVMTKVTKKGIEVHDPARGLRKIGFEEVSRSFTGIALELTPNSRFEKKDFVERINIFDLWTSANGLSVFLWQLGLLALIVQLFAILSPMLNQIIMDEAIVKGDVDLLNIIAIGMVIALFIQNLVILLQNFVGLYLGTQLSFQMKTNLLWHALKLSISWFEKRHIGDIISRFNSLDPIQKFISDAPVKLALNIIMFVVSLVMMFLYSWLLSLVVMLSTLLPFVVRAVFFPVIRSKTDEGISLTATANTVFMETIRGFRSFKLFNKEQERIALWQNEQIAATNNSVLLSKYNLFGNFGIAITIGLQNVGLWFIGANQVINGLLSIGMLIAFQSYALQFSNATKGIIDTYFQWKTIGLHLERLSDILHENFENRTNLSEIKSNAIDGRIECNNLSFRYADYEPYVLTKINLSVASGEFVSIIGPSGGGKTTLLKLLLGLLQPTEGDVLINDVGIKFFGIRNFRNQTAAVMQDDRLFQGTIADNVSFFDVNLDIEAVNSALRQACIFSEVMRMPMGLETLVGDLGSTLSGGQSQRILIARALYRKPKILFLDEGTANLDQNTELRIIENMKKLKITIISIAHRDLAIKSADRIVCVENGCVTALR